jgi:hypothetical protein
MKPATHAFARAAENESALLTDQSNLSSVKKTLDLEVRRLPIGGAPDIYIPLERANSLSDIVTPWPG